MSTQTSPADLLKFQVERNIIGLVKNCLIIVEDLCENSYNNNVNYDLGNLHSQSNTDYQKLRKRILDNGNNNIREIEELIDKLDIQLK